MKELLDENLHEEPKAPKWWSSFAFYIHRKLYWVTFAVAGSMLLMLFMRGPMGSDFDAMLALIVLFALMVNIFYKVTQDILPSSIYAMILLFGIFLNYAPSVVATIHNLDLTNVTCWKWSHYELIFGENLYFLTGSSFFVEESDMLFEPRTLFTTIIECTEWLLFYTLLTMLTAEIVHLILKKK